ncbi:3-demethylubiquinone-9 3-methyltransferase [Bradyrhizobium sp. LTSPM299]|uniref:VOC family protein n=1 Tax=Bradyrhizobium sp. LTSPM299 TaxID=1619233 RepID=UPI0005C9B292|nr:VOC family protein [Bradyrhizobium sp. LTSPM299]KJC58131.1 3-demethylubiquinone-9 3-methyltransferase [Bradyrhizobium sp. LTSPM299]
MQVNPYLYFDGNCEAALKFYQKVLGAKIEASFPFGEGPPEMPMPPEWKDKIMHAKITIDGEVIMASDAPPGHFQKPQGFSVSLQVEDPTEAGGRFKALADGGSITMPFGQTFFSKGFGMCVDQFGIPWMVNCPQEM